ncbi:hypothetical protein BU16DRAFT_531694 [Lophium mytilinum]|uniref:Uncharacterized protein n=1 Tax=Lophium mytilinum TaxID=390894 RepID=A0A6A6QBK2_9PEZI|nr:hypothetical protein BU16DRAFT_531694 [Lophium mytilinum]
MCPRRNNRRRGPIATLVLAGVALGTKKVQEKRKAREEEKATRAIEGELNYEEARRSAIQDAQMSRHSKEIEAQEENPPDYDNVPAWDYTTTYENKMDSGYGGRGIMVGDEKRTL